MKKIITIAAIVIATMINTRVAEASITDKEIIIRDAIEQLSVGNEATVYYIGGEYVTPMDIIEYACTHEDDPENLYDGSILELRGNMETTNVHGRLNVVIKRGFDIAEAEKLTDMMVDEISANLESDSSDREKMAAICDYISQTYSYDREALKLIEEKEDSSLRENFVDAYYGDREILCAEYATVTYILARKLGVNCKVIRGTRHAYNIVKFADSDHWIGYDLTGGERYAQIGDEWEMSTSGHNPEGVLEDVTATEDERKLAETAVKLNNGISYEIADRKDYFNDLRYFVLKRHYYRDLIDSVYLYYIICLVAIIPYMILGIALFLRFRPVRSWEERQKKRSGIRRGLKRRRL